MLTRRNAFLFGVAATISFMATSGSRSEPKLESRTSNENGVVVVVTPKHLGRNDPVWEFAISMDTHVRPLSEDIAKDSVLVDASGRRYTSAKWEGTGSGGHHRTGTLQFPRPETPSSSVVLEIDGVGGSAKRIFSWHLD